ncbi:unnamed protein product, partial [Chrysoparadoxa australica]
GAYTSRHTSESSVGHLSSSSVGPYGAVMGERGKRYKQGVVTSETGRHEAASTQERLEHEGGTTATATANPTGSSLLKQESYVASARGTQYNTSSALLTETLRAGPASTRAQVAAATS